MLLTLRSVYRLPLRALQGIASSLQRLAMPGLPVPNYSTLSRWAKALHLLVDSTCLKLFGQGACKVCKHGY